MTTSTATIKGMSCASCSAGVERVVGRLNFVSGVSVNLTTEKMTVSYDETAGNMDVISAAITKAGFKMVPRDQELSPLERMKEQDSELNDKRRRLIIAICFTLPLLYISMSQMAGLPYPAFIDPMAHPAAYAFFQMILAICVMISGRNFFIDGYRLLFAGHPNMDTLVAVGTSASFIYSVWSFVRILSGDTSAVMDMYFESCGLIITLIMVGKFMEARAKKKTRGAIAKLYDLVPSTAFVERSGDIMEIPAAELGLGDIMIIRPGAKIPADGVIVEGSSSIDELMLTGESMPVERGAGQNVAGATINKNGALKVKVTRLGEDSALSGIVRLVEEAQGMKTPIAKLADVVSGYLVPTAIVIAFAAGIAWLIAGKGISFSLRIFVSVLIIACPCALGLATPTAIMVGTGKGAADGILFKNGEALETLRNVDTIMFDKTGTLTDGRPRVTGIFTVEGITEPSLVFIAASVEKMTGHPLAEAIVQYAEGNGIKGTDCTGFENLPGHGVTAIVNGQTVLIGNASLMDENYVDITDLAFESYEMSNNAETPMFIAVDGKLIGVISVADSLKEGSTEVIKELREIGIKTIMITGDNAKTAQVIGKALGVDEILAEVLPADKRNKVSEVQAAGARVAMVGDGINDAPALAMADVGVAIGSGTDVAIESADVVLMGRSLISVISAVKLSRATIRIIKQNLFWAFCYNTIGIPIAAGILYLFGGPLFSPVIGAACMSLSSVCVVSNALRLRLIDTNKQ